MPTDPVSPLPDLPIDEVASQPLNIDHFSARFGLVVRGTNRPPHGDVEMVSTMPAGLYVSVHIQGTASSGLEGSEQQLRSHGLTALAVSHPSTWRARIAMSTVEALGVAMEIEQIRALGLGADFDALFAAGETIRNVQLSADFRTIQQARRAIATDVGAPLQLLRLEADALDILLKGFEALKLGSTRKPPRHREMLLALGERVEANLARDWTTADLAREGGMSARSLSTHFREEFGCTPFDFLRERRLLRARDIVVNGSTPIADIARVVGFGNATHFATAFRTRFGLSPMQMRAERPTV